MKRIIIVDDDPGIQDAFSMVFDTAEYDVTIYPNAESLLAGNFNMPHLFILDKQLSGVDGLDVCRYLKAQPGSKDVPVIMLSASPHITKWAMLAGADSALEKPFKLKDFRQLVASYF